MRIETAIGIFVGFVFGCGVGGSVSYFISESKFNKKMDSDYILRREEEKKSENKDETEEKQNDTEETADKETVSPQYRDITSIRTNEYDYADPNTRKETTTVNYSGYSVPEKPVEEEAMAPIEKDDAPYVISEEAYHNTYIEFGKRILNYFGQSHILIDEIDGSEVDPQQTVGVENLISLKKEGVIYVRNVMSGEDYMVSYNDGHYDNTY